MKKIKIILSAFIFVSAFASQQQRPPRTMQLPSGFTYVIPKTEKTLSVQPKDQITIQNNPNPTPKK